MLHIIDGLEVENKIEREKMLYDSLIQSMKNDEFMKHVEKLKELDFAEGLVLQTLFDYKLRDEYDQIDLAADVAKEYHSGKLDPQMGMKNEKKKRGEIIKKKS
jgi:hypothetical protein